MVNRANRISLVNAKARKVNLRLFVYLLVSLLATACIQSKSPIVVVEELLPVSPPNFGGGVAANSIIIISAPSVLFNVVGNCDDQNGYQTEYSLNNVSWIPVACTNKQFTVQVNLFLTSANVYARTRGKFKYSDVAHANVQFIPPPGADHMVPVSSSRSDFGDGIGDGTQNFLSTGLEHSTASNSTGLYNFSSGLLRFVYEP